MTPNVQRCRLPSLGFSIDWSEHNHSEHRKTRRDAMRARAATAYWCTKAIL